MPKMMQAKWEKLKKQNSLAIAERNFKKIVDDALDGTDYYRMVNMVTGEELPEPMSLDEIVKLPDRGAYEMHFLEKRYS